MAGSSDNPYEVDYNYYNNTPNQCKGIRCMARIRTGNPWLVCRFICNFNTLLGVMYQWE